MDIPDTIYTLDVLFGAFVVLFGVAGLFRGFAGGLSRLLTLILLLAGVCFFYPTLTELVAEQWPVLEPPAVKAAALTVLCLGAFLFYALLKAILERALKEQIGAFLNRAFGALMGLVFGVIIGLSIFCGISLLPQDRPYRILSEKSTVGNWVCTTLTPWVYPRLMDTPFFKGMEEGGSQESGDGGPESGDG